MVSLFLDWNIDRTLALVSSLSQRVETEATTRCIKMMSLYVGNPLWVQDYLTLVNKTVKKSLLAMIIQFGRPRVIICNVIRVCFWNWNLYLEPYIWSWAVCKSKLLFFGSRQGSRQMFLCYPTSDCFGTLVRLTDETCQHSTSGSKMSNR